MTQKEIIIQVLKQSKDWVPSYNLIKSDTPWGWLGTSADRIARYMVDPKNQMFTEEIERKEEGKYAYYKYAPKGQLRII